MAISLISPTLVLLVLILTGLSSADGQSPPTPPQPSLSGEAQEYLGAHNEARVAVGVGPLRWSDSLAKRASLLARYQRNNRGCGFANVTGAEPYGANQLWSGGSAAAQPPRAAVGKWVSEGKFYNHVDNTCAAGHQCGVYTQVVWRNTSDLGCASATCLKEKASLTICFYYPPGNYIGESPY